MSENCPECDAQKVTSRPHHIAFDYADRSGLVSIEADVTLFQCGSCGFSYLDHTAEEAKDLAVRKFLTASERITDVAFRPVVWVSSKSAFYDCSDDDFKRAFNALCRWSTPEPNGPAWVTPVLHEGLWHVSARHALIEAHNVVVKATTPEGATVALAVTLGLHGQG